MLTSRRENHCISAIDDGAGEERSHRNQPQYRPVRVDNCSVELRGDVARSVSRSRDFDRLQLTKEAFLSYAACSESITDRQQNAFTFKTLMEDRIEH